MKRIFLALVIVTIVLTQTGCSVFMAARQPKKKDISLFQVGTPRSKLVAEFGAPTISEEKDGKRYEIFKFCQGYPAPAKIGRALFHGAADVFSLGLWEIVGTPTEMVFDGKEMAYEVYYDGNNCIESVVEITKDNAKATNK
jgi:hypothetical protein